MTEPTTTTTTSITNPQLRDLFPDKETVLIYPDDFADDPNNIILSELVDRSTGHFSDKRIAVLFRPRPNEPYKDVNFPVGYWTQVLGLGETPEDVTFTGQLGIHAIPANTDNPGVGSLDTFWRSAENFVSDTSFVQNAENGGAWSVPVGNSTNLKPTQDGQFNKLYPLPQGYDNESSYQPEKGMIWAVSQAAPLRRIKVAGNLHLSLGNCYSSGGFMSNVDVVGYLLFGTQQQFCVRNSGLAQKAIGGAWSFVFNGCNFGLGSLEWIYPNGMVVNEPTTSIQIEKPFIFIGNDDNKLYLGVPKMKQNSRGTNLGKLEDDEKILIDNKDMVRVILPSDPFESVQDVVSKGTHIILSPGTYSWNKPLHITTDNQVILGIGMATIQAPLDGKHPCIRVASGTSGVRISGISLEASAIPEADYKGSSLLEWGQQGQKDPGDPKNPGVIHDLYCFVGGRSESRHVKVEVMVRIHSGNVVGDNLWLWRADHVKLASGEKPNRPELSEYHVTTYGECKCEKGLEVYGDNVLFHGLAVEHTYDDLVSWHGKNGSVHFYQSELPYDVPGNHFQNKAGYRVHETGHGHSGNGVGVYSYFRDYDDVQVDSAIAHHALEGKYANSFTVWLDGHGKNAIRSVINEIGGATLKQGIPVNVPYYQYSGTTAKKQRTGGTVPLWSAATILTVILGIVVFVGLSRYNAAAVGGTTPVVPIKKISSSSQGDFELVNVHDNDNEESEDEAIINPLTKHVEDNNNNTNIEAE